MTTLELLIDVMGRNAEMFKGHIADFSDADITDKALKALGNYYKATGPRLVPRLQYKVIPSEIRVLTHDGTETHRWTILDLAKSLGKAPP